MNKPMRLLVKIMMGAAALAATACSPGARSESAGRSEAAPTRAEVLGHFDADSAYAHVARQVAFGPRVPGSDAHVACGAYIVDRLKAYGADTVQVHRASVTTFEGKTIPMANIIASYNPQASRRILLAAHYDSRPVADQDPDPANHDRPIPGANDGASGAGVLLEIARNLGSTRPDVGVDLAFLDCEDGGSSDPAIADGGWCLGSRKWMESDKAYSPATRPDFGILLDMVGGRGARFLYEYFSINEAPAPTVKVWNEARALGFGDVFVPETGGAVNDDHVPLILAGIPTTDIIECNNPVTGSFPPYWHTMADDMTNIDPATLGAVGTTVLNVVLKEKPQP